MVDKRNKYHRVVSMLKPYVNKVLTVDKLKNLIRENVGGTERVVSDTLRLMVSTKLIVLVNGLNYKVSDL